MERVELSEQQKNKLIAYIETLRPYLKLSTYLDIMQKLK